MTAVEQVKKELEKYGNPVVCEVLWEDFDSLVEQAKQMEKQQIEISDEEICKQAEIEYPFGDYDRDNWLRRRGFIKGMIKYREQLKSKQ